MRLAPLVAVALYLKSAIVGDEFKLFVAHPAPGVWVPSAPEYGSIARPPDPTMVPVNETRWEA